MPTVKNGDAEIYYEVCGTGFPILTFAPKGLFSTIEVWDLPNAPIKPVYEYSDDFQIITMDQRNSGGKSIAPVTSETDWESYASDQLAVLDDLNIEHCHLYGQCIGGPFILKLLQMQPERFASAVLAQPIGRVESCPLPKQTEVYNRWAQSLNPVPDNQVIKQVYKNLYGPGFAYSVSKEFLARCSTPTMVLAGNDLAHPFTVAEEISEILPNNEEFIANWKEGDALKVAREKIHSFLKKYTPEAL